MINKMTAYVGIAIKDKIEEGEGMVEVKVGSTVIFILKSKEKGVFMAPFFYVKNFFNV